MKAIDKRLRRLQESFAPQENEEVRSLVVLLRERRRRRLEANGEPFESRPCEWLMIKKGLYRLPTSCGWGVGAPERRTSARQDSYRY